MVRLESHALMGGDRDYLHSTLSFIWKRNFPSPNEATFPGSHKVADYLQCQHKLTISVLPKWMDYFFHCLSHHCHNYKSLQKKKKKKTLVLKVLLVVMYMQKSNGTGGRGRGREEDRMTLKINFSQVQTFSYTRSPLHSKDPEYRS